MKRNEAKVKKARDRGRKYFVEKNQKQGIGYKFKRQYSVGKYVLDFYCSELKLAVELDGGDHYEEKNIKRDSLRTEYLEKFGIRVKRYTNLDVKNNINSVIMDLSWECEKTAKEPHPNPILN